MPTSNVRVKWSRDLQIATNFTLSHCEALTHYIKIHEEHNMDMNDHGWVIAGILRQSRYFAHLPSVGSSSIAFQSFMVLPVPMRPMVPLSTLLFFHLNIYSMLKINWQQIHCYMHILSNTILIYYIINAVNMSIDAGAWSHQLQKSEFEKAKFIQISGRKTSVTFVAFNCALRFAAGSKTSGHPWGIHGPSTFIPSDVGVLGVAHARSRPQRTVGPYTRHRPVATGVQVLEYIGIYMGSHMWPCIFPSSLGTIALEVTKCHNERFWRLANCQTNSQTKNASEWKVVRMCWLHQIQRYGRRRDQHLCRGVLLKQHLNLICTPCSTTHVSHMPHRWHPVNGGRTHVFWKKCRFTLIVRGLWVEGNSPEDVQKPESRVNTFSGGPALAAFMYIRMSRSRFGVVSQIQWEPGEWPSISERLRREWSYPWQQRRGATMGCWGLSSFMRFYYLDHLDVLESRRWQKDGFFPSLQTNQQNVLSSTHCAVSKVVSHFLKSGISQIDFPLGSG